MGKGSTPQGDCRGPRLRDPAQVPLGALEAEMQTRVGQPAAPSDVHMARAPARCCVPAEGPRTFHYYTTFSDWPPTRVSKGVIGASSSHVLPDRPCSWDAFV